MEKKKKKYFQGKKLASKNAELIVRTWAILDKLTIENLPLDLYLL